jgi:hypothetical protein
VSYEAQLAANYAAVRRRLNAGPPIRMTWREPKVRMTWREPKVEPVEPYSSDDIKPRVARILQELKFYEQVFCKDVVREVAHEFGVEVEELAGRSHRWAVSHPRQIAMVICKELGNRSTAQIGRQFGRDHTTVIHALRKWGDTVRELRGK